MSHRLQPGGGLLACADDAETAALVEQRARQACQAWTYGLTARADYRLPGHRRAQQPRGGYQFQGLLPAQGQPIAAGAGRSAGARAAQCAQRPGGPGAGSPAGLPSEPAADALAEFSGTGRRFELLGEAGGITIIDDYAHHPTEIRATLAAARPRYPDRRIWAVWQPHTYLAHPAPCSTSSRRPSAMPTG